MSVFGFLGTTILPRWRGLVKVMQPVHGAGDGGPNRWLSCSHPRIGYRLTKFDLGFPLSKNGYFSDGTPRVPLSKAAISSELHRQSVSSRQAGMGVFRAMSQMKPTSSRAMAASTRGCGFPAFDRCRNRLHNRVCAFQPISLISCDRCSERFR